MAINILTATLGGRELEVEANLEGRRFRGVVPQALLDDQVGAEAAQRDREAWVLGNAPAVEMALRDKADGRPVGEPFDAIELREVL